MRHDSWPDLGWAVQREVMTTLLFIAPHKQAAKHIGQELRPYEKWRGSVEQMTSLLFRKIRDRGQVELDRVIQGMKNVLKGSALDRNIQIQADRFPIALSPFRIASQDPAHHPIPRRRQGARTTKPRVFLPNW